MKDVCIHKNLSFLKKNCQTINVQHCLVVTIEKWQKSLDKGESFGALLTDLSKAFDCLPRDLLVAKFNFAIAIIKRETLVNFNLNASKQYIMARKQCLF